MQSSAVYPRAQTEPQLIRTTTAGRAWIAPRRLPAGSRLRVGLSALVLVALSLPSIANVSIGVRFAMLSGDLKVFQGLMGAASILLVVWHRSVRRIPSVMGLLALVWIVILFNTTTALASDPRLLPALTRGILNLSINVLIALGMSYVVRHAASATTFAKAIGAFGVLVAASAVLEYVLLKSSVALLIEWRKLVWGSVDPSELLKIGGVTLDPVGLARVGGIIGAPENLGYVLGLTLAFVMLLELTPMAQGALLVLYTVAAVVTGSRTLTIAIAIFGLLVLRPRGLRTRNRAVVVGGVVLAILVLGWLSVNEEAFARFSLDALRYELLWRSDRLAVLLAATANQPNGWLTGIGFGSGADLQSGVESVTSGVLGGDVAVAFGLGGLIGLFVLGGFWTVLFTLRRRVRTAPASVRLAVDMYLMFVGAVSLLFPVFLQLVLSTGIICLLLVTFLVVADVARTGERTTPGRPS